MTTRAKLFALLPFCCLVTLSACGSAPEAPATEVEETAAAPRSDSTLVIGETTYDLLVRSCNLEGDDDGTGPNTLDATAIAPDEDRHSLEVSRIGNNQSILLLISYADRLGWEAEWNAATGGEQLVEIDGRTVRATTTFTSLDGSQEASGSLAAVCP